MIDRAMLKSQAAILDSRVLAALWGPLHSHGMSEFVKSLGSGGHGKGHQFFSVHWHAVACMTC